MSAAVEVALLCAGFAILGTMLHEASHAAVAMATGRFVEFDVRSWEVYYRGRRPPGRVEYAIAAAPIAAGVLAVPALFLLDVGLPGWVGWAVLTIGGVVPLPGIGRGLDFQFQEA